MKEVVTDGHIEIAALMKREEKYKEVTHQNDVWHGAKNIAKKITTAAKSKDNADLTLWAPSIRNHFWYCSKTCANDSKNLKVRFTLKYYWFLQQYLSSSCKLYIHVLICSHLMLYLDFTPCC
ncbi:uncharacterized protein LOC114516154 isoform X1 [Dendronephthya gigantea]|uniref:uncharacterized protein LOC114516154 isoform X1 n=1 Tax=Dendronephthya gigantea TaxID=151771 RepID=UPI00106D4496|nr:uncharacterized protein LOC114516154 isoform X1 [Dendronephthya gigantea]